MKELFSLGGLQQRLALVVELDRIDIDRAVNTAGRVQRADLIRQFVDDVDRIGQRQRPLRLQELS